MFVYLPADTAKQVPHPENRVIYKNLLILPYGAYQYLLDSPVGGCEGHENASLGETR